MLQTESTGFLYKLKTWNKIWLFKSELKSSFPLLTNPDLGEKIEAELEVKVSHSMKREAKEKARVTSAIPDNR